MGTHHQRFAAGPGFGFAVATFFASYEQGGAQREDRGERCNNAEHNEW
jgi:hypothetical protein